jgi:hypothetical protein
MRPARDEVRCRSRTRPHGVLLPLALAMLVTACGPSGGAAEDSAGAAAAPTPPREGRFGSLRDFVLVERPALAAGDGDRGPSYFFLDRFEVTRGDWVTFAAAREGEAVAAGEAAIGGDPALPVGRVDLRQARAFARWRFARLPRLDEWQLATEGVRPRFPSASSENRFPWGSKADAARANAAELGLGEPTPVGTFESGRRADGMPYDLIGNVSEWTETVPWSWCVDDGMFQTDRVTLTSGAAVDWLQRRILRAPGLSVWQGPGGLLPLACAVALGGADVPREVAGADFLTSMTKQTESVLAGDRRLRTGVRLCTTPVELLRALLTTTYQPTDEELEQLRRFVMRGRHREVLQMAWQQVESTVPAAEREGLLGRWLAGHLRDPNAPRSGG